MSGERALGEFLSPDVLTPVQWYAGVHANDPRFHGTKQLMLAVLVDALRCFQNRRNAAEAEAWIADRHARGPFAFEIVCGVLGIDADYLRSGLSEWRGRNLRKTRPHLLMAHSSKRCSGAISLPFGRAAKRGKAKEAVQA